MEVAAVSLPGPLTLSPSFVYVAYISPSLPSGCGINFARRVRPDRNERPSGEMAARREKEAACQIDCTEGGEERGKSGRSLGSLHLCRACSAPT